VTVPALADRARRAARVLPPRIREYARGLALATEETTDGRGEGGYEARVAGLLDRP
jgi:hypothetical protein